MSALKFWKNDDKVKFKMEPIKKILKIGYERPNCQRRIDESHISVMRVDFEKMFNPVTPLYFCKLNKKRWIIDGQHRLKLYSDYKELENERVPIIEIIVKEQKDIYEYFKLINTHKEICDVWLKEESIREIVTKTYDHFIQKYHYTFKLPKPRCRPYIAPTMFMNQLTNLIEDEEYDIIDKYEIKTSDDYISILENLNKLYSEQEPNFYPDKEKRTNNLLNKIKKNNGLYFGMLKNSWMNNIINFTIPENTGQIPSSVRFATWNKWIGREYGVAKCWCCNENEVSQQCFEAGHVKARVLGGKNTVENLRPICSFCNQSMGTQNMFRFMKDKSYNHQN